MAAQSMVCDVCGAPLFYNICSDCGFDNTYQITESRIYTFVQNYLQLYGRDEKVYDALVEITGKSIEEIMQVIYILDCYDIEGLNLDEQGILNDY